MDQTVLNVAGMLDKGRVVRSYAFCAKSQASEHVSFPLEKGDVVVLVRLGLCRLVLNLRLTL
jgi:hypothetical protein